MHCTQGGSYDCAQNVPSKISSNMSTSAARRIFLREELVVQPVPSSTCWRSTSETV